LVADSARVVWSRLAERKDSIDVVNIGDWRHDPLFAAHLSTRGVD
jgi:hypothetical protein